ncbi:MAG: hypothetical protein KTR18_10220 [Acidiferrobacterales bacterium]|nr:hypothetical protein [Acidiferrobacterales bacterium]
MGSPITTWDSVEAYFTGFGGATTMIVFLLAVAVTAGAIYLGHRHEEEAYSKLKEK